MPARILIIEDNVDNLELMTYLLKAFGHSPIIAPNGEEGMELARRERPDLIVCDIQLPGMDGYGVAAHLKADSGLRGIPLIAVTALAMVGDRDKVRAGGFEGYIPKPIAPETFVAQVEAFLGLDQRSTPPVSAGSIAAAVATPTKRATILVVDDEPVNLSLKQSILEPMGYAVVTANHITLALKLARETRPDLIMSDLGMSEGSGFDFIKAIKEDPQLKDIPFVFITSTFYNQSARAKGLALGAARFLFRPIDPQELLAEIEACLREAKRS